MDRKFIKNKINCIEDKLCNIASLLDKSQDGTQPAGISTFAEQLNQSGLLVGINSTLVSILSSIAKSQDFEILLVVDEGNGNEIVKEIKEYDEGSGVWTTRYEDVNQAAYTPVGPLSYIDSSGILNLILAELQKIYGLLNYTYWEFTAGNTKEINYYASSTPGTVPANPSGSDKNIETVILKQGTTTFLTLTFSYNTDDNVVSIVTT